MHSTRIIVAAALAAFAASGVAATKGKPEAKPAAKAEAKPAVKKLRGKQETLACRLGTEDRHARIAVVTIGGFVDSFAYYSKWKPRTCSVYLQRDRDMYSKWADTGKMTTVEIEKGTFLVENRKNEYHFIFRNIDRERYCGMDGVINGTLTIKKGSDACELGGDIMVEGTPLGQAFAGREEEKAPVGLLPVTTQEAAKAPADQSPSIVNAPEKPAETPPQAQPQPQTQAPTPTAERTAAKPAPTAAAEKPAPTSTAEKPAPTATAEKPASTAAADTPAPTAAAEKPAAPASAPQKTAEPASSGGFRSFFRSLSESKGPQTSGRSD
jgi:hypothetical protein